MRSHLLMHTGGEDSGREANLRDKDGTGFRGFQGLGGRLSADVAPQLCSA